MATPFSAEPKLINELFGRDISYTIPEYQRPYSWECLGKSDKNNQVNVMWEDIFNFYQGSRTNTDYFFGSIVLIDKKNQHYDVIDGQQRLTTIILLFVSIKCFLKTVIEEPTTTDEIKKFAGQASSFIDEMIYNKKLIGVTPVQKKLKIEKNSGFEYDLIFAEVVEGRDIISDEFKKGAKKEQLQVISRYLRNRDFFQNKIGSNFSTNGDFTIRDAENLNDFIEFLKNRVSLVRILATDFNVAYHVFEILNNRGLPLSNKDLFRNFIIKEFDFLKKSDEQKYAHIDSNEKWNNLEKNFEVSDDFIGRWVESYTAGQQKSSSFNDLKDIYSKYPDKLFTSKIELLYDDITRDLAYYSSIISSTVENPTIKSKICFIINAPNVRYGLNFLLALAKQNKGFTENVDYLIRILTEYERYIINSLLIDRFSSAPVYKAIGSLNANNLNAAINSFSGHYSEEKLISVINGEISDNEVACLMIAKYVWINESKSNGDLVSQVMYYDKATLEHVIPQTPDKNTNWVSDFSQTFKNRYTYRLGNMTLLTQRLNSAAKNHDFAKKKNYYSKTKLPVTVELASLGSIDEQYITERQEKIVNAIYQDLFLPNPN